jgi:hypothetical protein
MHHPMTDGIGRADLRALAQHADQAVGRGAHILVADALNFFVHQFHRRLARCKQREANTR